MEAASRRGRRYKDYSRSHEYMPQYIILRRLWKEHSEVEAKKKSGALK